MNHPTDPDFEHPENRKFGFSTSPALNYDEKKRLITEYLGCPFDPFQLYYVLLRYDADHPNGIIEKISSDEIIFALKENYGKVVKEAASWLKQNNTKFEVRELTEYYNESVEQDVGLENIGECTTN